MSLLQRLMSNPGTTVEELERRHRGEIPRDQMPKPVGEEAPPGGMNGVALVNMPPKDLASHMNRVSNIHKDEPDSPNTALKGSLNILPPPDVKPKDTASSSIPLPSMSAINVPVSHETLLRTSTAPALLKSVTVPSKSTALPSQGSSNVLSSNVSINQSSVTTMPHLNTESSNPKPNSSIPEELPANNSLSNFYAPLIGAPAGSVPLQGPTAAIPLQAPTGPGSRIDGEGLITPQALLKQCATSLPSNALPQVSFKSALTSVIVKFYKFGG